MAAFKTVVPAILIVLAVLTKESSCQFEFEPKMRDIMEKLKEITDDLDVAITSSNEAYNTTVATNMFNIITFQTNSAINNAAKATIRNARIRICISNANTKYVQLRSKVITQYTQCATNIASGLSKVAKQLFDLNAKLLNNINQHGTIMFFLCGSESDVKKCLDKAGINFAKVLEPSEKTVKSLAAETKAFLEPQQLCQSNAVTLAMNEGQAIVNTLYKCAPSLKPTGK